MSSTKHYIWEMNILKFAAKNINNGMLEFQVLKLILLNSYQINYKKLMCVSADRKTETLQKFTLTAIIKVMLKSDML